MIDPPLTGPASTTVLLTAELATIVTALWHEIDHGDGSAAATFFSADAELTFDRRTVRGRVRIAEVYRARTARGPRVSRHVTGNLHVIRHDDDTAETVSALVLYAADGEPPIPGTAPLLVADVHDRFRWAAEPPGSWLITSRRIDHRFVAPGAVLAVPTEPEDTP